MTPATTAGEWNERHPIGTPVRFEVYRGGPVEESVTRSEAWTLGHGAAVVKIAGRAGGVCLDFLTVVGEVSR